MNDWILIFIHLSILIFTWTRLRRKSSRLEKENANQLVEINTWKQKANTYRKMLYEDE